MATAPVIFVRDVHAAAGHYRDAMGFSFGKIWGEPPSFAILKRDDMYVMIKQIEDHKHIVPRRTVSAGLWDMYFWVDDVDALYKEFVERGAKIDYELCDRRARYWLWAGRFSMIGDDEAIGIHRSAIRTLAEEPTAFTGWLCHRPATMIDSSSIPPRRPGRRTRGYGRIAGRTALATSLRAFADFNSPWDERYRSATRR
jgi:hypothetical protein